MTFQGTQKGENHVGCDSRMENGQVCNSSSKLN